jgi:hypothetical protein
MNRFFGMMRYSKQALIVFIAFMVELAYVLGVVIFDLVQFILVKNNSAKLSPAFVPVNISLIVVINVSLFVIVSIMFLLLGFSIALY